MSGRVRSSWKGQQAIVGAAGGGQDGLEKAGAMILAHSQGFVPYDTGELAATGIIRAEPGRVRIMYTKLYAIFLHAHPEYHFQNSRRARFLEKALADKRKQALQDQAAAVQAGMGRELPR